MSIAIKTITDAADKLAHYGHALPQHSIGAARCTYKDFIDAEKLGKYPQELALRLISQAATAKGYAIGHQDGTKAATASKTTSQTS